MKREGDSVGKKLPTLLNDAYSKGYCKGHEDATRIIMRLTHMAFCVALNKELGIGAERFERVRKTADKYLGDDIVSDIELAAERLNREYKRITGTDITDVLK